MSFHPLEQKLIDTIQKHGLLRAQDSVLIGVSGGCDSVALFRLLLAISPLWQLKIHVVHFDHGLRPESIQEAQFVKELVTSHAQVFHSYTSQTLNGHDSGIQEKARAWRMDMSETLCQKIGAQHIATAHHADDQLETIFHKILRGCHLSNIRGMEQQRPPYLRPLLGFSKSELQCYLEDLSQPWMEDASNQSSKYLRNRIRLELIPLLKDLSRGDLDIRMQELVKQSAQLHNWLEEAKTQVFADIPANPLECLSIKYLLSQPTMVQGAVLHQFLTQQGATHVETKHIIQINDLLQSTNRQWVLHLPGKVSLHCEGEELFVKRRAKNFELQFRYLAPNEVFPETGMVLFNVPPQAQLSLRYRKPGDRFHPHWRKNNLKLKDFLRDQQIPLHERNKIPLICNADEVLAIFPLFRSNKTAFDQKEYPPLHLNVSKASD